MRDEEKYDKKKKSGLRESLGLRKREDKLGRGRENAYRCRPLASESVW